MCLRKITVLNHIIGNDTHFGDCKVCFSRSSQVTVEEMNNWKATPRDNVFSIISNGATLHDS